jgi:hypothetical protein
MVVGLVGMGAYRAYRVWELGNVGAWERGSLGAWELGSLGAWERTELGSILRQAHRKWEGGVPLAMEKCITPLR